MRTRTKKAEAETGDPRMTDNDETVFTAHYSTVEQFKRYYHTIENHARREKCVCVIHKLQTGEVLKETRLDGDGS